jgi:hypothetical protein
VDQRQLNLHPDLLGRQDVDGVVDQPLAGGLDLEGDPVGVGTDLDGGGTIGGRRLLVRLGGNLDRDGLLLGDRGSFTGSRGRKALMAAMSEAIGEFSTRIRKCRGPRRRPSLEGLLWGSQGNPVRVDAPARGGNEDWCDLTGVE